MVSNAFNDLHAFCVITSRNRVTPAIAVASPAATVAGVIAAALPGEGAGEEAGEGAGEEAGERGGAGSGAAAAPEALWVAALAAGAGAGAGAGAPRVASKKHPLRSQRRPAVVVCPTSPPNSIRSDVTPSFDQPLSTSQHSSAARRLSNQKRW